MGVKGYSEPQYFHLYHNGKVPEGDGFQSCAIQIRARTEAELHSIWNYRPANQLFTQADLDAAVAAERKFAVDELQMREAECAQWFQTTGQHADVYDQLAYASATIRARGDWTAR